MDKAKEFEAELDSLMAKYRAKEIGFEPYRNLWKEVVRSGFRIKRGWIDHKLVHVVSPKKRNMNAPWKELNLNPDGKSIGDCTTRALAYCFPEVGYHKLNQLQRTIAREFGFGWKSPFTWHQVAKETGGYEFFELRKKMSRANVAKLFSGLAKPVFTSSSRHVAVVDKGTVIDSWDSRGGRVVKVGLAPCDIPKAKDFIYA